MKKLNKLKQIFKKKPKAGSADDVTSIKADSFDEIYEKNKNLLSAETSIADEEETISDVSVRNDENKSELSVPKTTSNTDSSSFLHKIPSFLNQSSLVNSQASSIRSSISRDDGLETLDENNFSNLLASNTNLAALGQPKTVPPPLNYLNMTLKELIELDECSSVSDADDDFDLNLIEFTDSLHLQEFNREHWLVSKLVRYLKTGNTTATYIALAIIRDLDLNRESTMCSFINTSAILVLVNLLTTNDIKCQCGSMQILKELSNNKRMAFEIIKEGGILGLIQNLSELDDDAKCLAAECLANLSMLKIARTIIRKQNGIHRLITLLGFSHVTKKQLNTRLRKQTANGQTLKNYELIKCVSYALFALSKDTINHYIMLKHGLIILLSNIIKTISNEKAIYWLIALLDNCASTQSYVVAIIHENLIERLISRLYETKDLGLKNYIVGIFSKCSKEEKFCAIIKQTNCLELLCQSAEDAIQSLSIFGTAQSSLLKQQRGSSPRASVVLQVPTMMMNNARDTEKPSEKLIRNIAGTLAGCCINSPNLLDYLNKSKIIEKLVSILRCYQDQTDFKICFNETTIINITRTMSVSVYMVENRKKLFSLDAIRIFINLLKTNNNEIIKNTCYILGLCSLEDECLHEIHRLDAIRLIWSLLRNEIPQVQASACWLLYVCIARIKNFGELVRNLTGGIEILLNLLDKSNHVNMLAYACAAISKIAIDNYNLAVMSDYRAIEKLIKLVLKYYDVNDGRQSMLLLKMFLAEAIAQCSRDARNSYKFGKEGIVEPLVKYLISIMSKSESKKARAKKMGTDLHYCPCGDVDVTSIELHKSLIKALKELSNCSLNCFKMYKQNILGYLLDSIGSTDELIQRDSAICLKNIRKLVQRTKDKCYRHNKNTLTKTQQSNKMKIFNLPNEKKFSFEEIQTQEETMFNLEESQSEDEDDNDNDLDIRCKPNEECECKLAAQFI